MGNLDPAAGGEGYDGHFALSVSRRIDSFVGDNIGAGNASANGSECRGADEADSIEENVQTLRVG